MIADKTSASNQAKGLSVYPLTGNTLTLHIESLISNDVPTPRIGEGG